MSSSFEMCPTHFSKGAKKILGEVWPPLRRPPGYGPGNNTKTHTNHLIVAQLTKLCPITGSKIWQSVYVVEVTCLLDNYCFSTFMLSTVYFIILCPYVFPTHFLPFHICFMHQ